MRTPKVKDTAAGWAIRGSWPTWRIAQHVPILWGGGGGGGGARGTAGVRHLRRLMPVSSTQAGFPPSEYQLGRTMVFGSAGLEAQFAEKASELRQKREIEQRARREKAEAMSAEQAARLAEMEREREEAHAAMLAAAEAATTDAEARRQVHRWP